MKTILVTGGAGFIGSHTCLLLLESGFDLIVLDSFVNSSPIALKRVDTLARSGSNLSFIEGDIRDHQVLNEIFTSIRHAGKKIDAVIHFAGLKSVPESFENPDKYKDVNVNGTKVLLSAMQKHNCKTIVFSSSATVYGPTKSLPINELGNISPLNPYGQTKAEIEEMLVNLFDLSNSTWRIAILRYFNPIGAHKSGLLGENPLVKNTNLFPLLARVAAGKQNSLKVFGSDWDTPDGTQIRDYIHVMDLAEGHIDALKYLFIHKPRCIKLNLGTGIGHSVFQVIKEFEKCCGKRIPLEIEQKRQGDVQRSIADPSLAKSILRWEAKRSLKQSCKDTWNWELHNPLGYKE